MKIAIVMPLRKGFWKEDLTYFTAKDVKEGDIAKISLRGKDTLGLIISSEEASSQKVGIKEMSFNLKKITEVKSFSIWRKEFLEAILESSKYFASNKSQAAATLIPAVFRENYDQFAIFARSPIVENFKNLRAEKLLFQTSLEDRFSFYKTMIRGSFAEKKSVFIVLPTERDIEIFYASLSRGIENFAFSFHSGMTPKKIIDEYGRAVSSAHPVLILGTAPFLSIARNDLGTIVVEHESSSAYKTQNRPYFDLRIFAEIFAQKISARFILGDSLLRFESIAKKGMTGWAEFQPLSFRNDFRGEIIISGKYEENERNKKFKILSDVSIKKIERAVETGKNVFIFSLRKGLATYTICRDCQEPLLCEKCLSPVVLYTSKDGNKRMFSCNRCRLEKDPNTRCPNCSSWNLLPLGIGTETVYEEVKRIFSEKKKQVKILRLDKESAKTAKGAAKIVKVFEDEAGAILIGTELALFYLEKKIPLSVIVSFDSLWSIPNFRMSEKIIQLLISIISKTTETLSIETRNENDSGIMAVRRDALLQFIRSELEERKMLGYPPFKRFIKITHEGNKDETLEAKKALEGVFREYHPEIFSGFVPKVRNKYIINTLIKLPVENWSLPELEPGSTLDQNLLSRLLALPPSFTASVDPEDLL